MRGLGRVGAAAALLLWPAWLNGYPLVFSDTGTYLSQVPDHHLGWDRPPFYSAFVLALGWERTLWTVVAAQALLTGWLLDLTRRTLVPRSPGWLTLLIAAVLAGATALPWVVSQVMPDVLTGLLVLALIALAFGAPPWERCVLAAFAAFAIAAHLSHVALAMGMLAIGVAYRHLRHSRGSGNRCRDHRQPGGMRPRFRGGDERRAFACLLLPVPVALLTLGGVNLVARGSFAIAPYGSVFLLARGLEDGPARNVLAADCAVARWRLCEWRERMPATADDFLWGPDSPLAGVGGPRTAAAEASAIVAASWREEPARMAEAMLRDTGTQLAAFATGDGLRPWLATVTPWIVRDFPAHEQRAYAAARQTNGLTLVPGWLSTLHVAAGLGGCAASLAMLPWLSRRRSRLGWATGAVFGALLLNAFVTGALSGPHPRYQSRIMWLPVLTAVLGIAEATQDRP